MNIGLILAAGRSERMKSDYPKQFLTIFNKPVIIYTLEIFQHHPEIDAILVVCLDGWQKKLKKMADDYEITKLKWIVPGGESGQDSIRMGVEELEKHFKPDDIVVLHDANRPLVTNEIITDCISVCRKNGNGISSTPVVAALGVSDDKIKAEETLQYTERPIMVMVKPEAYRLGKMSWAYREATRRGVTDTITYSSLMIKLGEPVYFAKGSEKNIKITRPEDVDIFKALLIALGEVKIDEIGEWG